MFHTVAFTKSHDNTANTALDPVPDSTLVIQNGAFLLQRDYDICYAAFMALTAQRCRIVAPSMRQITLPFITPIITTTLPTLPLQVADYRAYPLTARRLESLSVEATHTTGGGTRSTVIMGLRLQPFAPVPNGQLYTMRGTSTTAATANAWSLLAVTWADVLPTGRYAACGLRIQSTNAQAGRLQFEDQSNRPGVMTGAALGDNVHPMFVKGGLGIMGYFDANRMPNIEVLCNAADAAHDVLLDLVRIG